jgi:hypothetical protein
MRRNCILYCGEIIKIFTRNYYTSVISKKIDSGKVFIVGGRSFIYIMKSKGPKIDPWGIPCFIVPHFEENSSNNLSSVLCFLFVR